MVPEAPLGRTFRDVAGLAHQRLASVADEVYFGVMGVMLRLKPGPVVPVVGGTSSVTMLASTCYSDCPCAGTLLDSAGDHLDHKTKSAAAWAGLRSWPAARRRDLPNADPRHAGQGGGRQAPPTTERAEEWRRRFTCRR